MRRGLVTMAQRAGDAAGTKLLSPPSSAFGFYVNHGPRAEKAVALTFDDGPSRGGTEDLLDALDELDVKATFFCVGANAELNPELIRRIDREGHVVGNHSYGHSRRAGLAWSDTDHIDRGERAIVAALGPGRTPRLYRPPWGWLTPWEGRRLHQRGYTIVGWDVYTLDWQEQPPPASVIAADAARDARPGSIFCFHDGGPHSVSWPKQVTTDAVCRLVPALREQGYRFVTVAELLGVPAYAGSPSFGANGATAARA